MTFSPHNAVLRGAAVMLLVLVLGAPIGIAIYLSGAGAPGPGLCGAVLTSAAVALLAGLCATALAWPLVRLPGRLGAVVRSVAVLPSLVPSAVTSVAAADLGRGVGLIGATNAAGPGPGIAVLTLAVLLGCVGPAAIVWSLLRARGLSPPRVVWATVLMAGALAWGDFGAALAVSALVPGGVWTLGLYAWHETVTVASVPAATWAAAIHGAVLLGVVILALVGLLRRPGRECARRPGTEITWQTVPETPVGRGRLAAGILVAVLLLAPVVFALLRHHGGLIPDWSRYLLRTGAVTVDATVVSLVLGGLATYGLPRWSLLPVATPLTVGVVVVAATSQLPDPVVSSALLVPLGEAFIGVPVVAFVSAILRTLGVGPVRALCAAGVWCLVAVGADDTAAAFIARPDRQTLSVYVLTLVRDGQLDTALTTGVVVTAGLALVAGVALAIAPEILRGPRRLPAVQRDEYR